MAFDAIVIGAGINGLAAALHLTARGWKVVAVEAETTAGGAVKTREATLPGFRHDLGAMNLAMFAGSPFFATYRDELQAHGLRLIPVANCFASVFPDGTSLGIGTEAGRNAAAIAMLSDEDAQAWQALTAKFAADLPTIFGLLGSPMPSLNSAKILWRLWRARGTAGIYDMVRTLLASPRDFLDARFRHPKVKAMMCAWGMHLDFPPDAAGGALFPYVESLASQAFGMAIGEGGADTVISAMIAAIEARGGQLLLGSGVKAVFVERGRARAVILADGREIAADRAIIANVHPKILFDRLIPASPSPYYVETLKSFRAGPGTMMIHLAMRRLPRWRAGEALASYAYVHIAPDLEMMARAYAEACAGLLPDVPALVVGQPTALDATRAPPGHHVLWIQARVLPAHIHGDARGEIDGRSWDDVKTAYADRVLDIVEDYAPGFRDDIMGRAIFSPADLERDNPNLIGGDSLSGSHHLDQNFLFRPVAGYSRYNTPVKRLYVCGASTWPGAGTAAASGFMLAKMLAR